ncbi:MAG: TPM domain-containing protein [Lachnospiraceae bacterium]|nr:TPM domain-containing protein [Lachnospiraceae bacterium]
MPRMKITFVLLTILSCLTLPVSPVWAEERNNNSDTGYSVYIEDDAELLSEEEEQELNSHMQPVTEYGDVLFITVNENKDTSDALIRRIYEERFSPEESIIVLIDMENRNIQISGGGELKTVITNSVANTIADNTYLYATKGGYAECAYETFDQIFAKLNGEKIAQPLKYTSNVLLALIIAFIVNYGFVRAYSAKHKTSAEKMLNGITKYCMITNPHADHIHVTESYQPRSSGGSGGGGFRSGGGSHGGGFHGGGGGFHGGGGASSGGHHF